MASAIALNLTSCTKDDNNAPQLGTTPLHDLIKQDTSLSIFTAILERSHLDIYTKGPGPFTVFAPTNSAYRQQGINTVADVATQDSTFLLNKTAYIIATGARSSYYLVGLNVPISTVLSTPVFSATATADSVYFNGFGAKKKDIMASNGVLHIMDICMLPNTNTTSVTLSQYPGTFKLFSQAIARATSGATVVNTATTTVFAPTNDAMIAAGYDSVAISKATAANLANLVRYHTTSTRYYRFALKSGDLKMVLGRTVLINNTGTTVTVKGSGNATPANFVSYALLPTPVTTLSMVPSVNMTSSNGAIHAIDKVLVP